MELERDGGIYLESSLSAPEAWVILRNAEGRQSPKGASRVIIYINNNKTYNFVRPRWTWIKMEIQTPTKLDGDEKDKLRTQTLSE